jgi:multidrug transporter EmrE-like cation transporter
MYVMGFVVAALLVVGQGLWKIAVNNAHLELTASYLLSRRSLELLGSPFLWAGLTVYAAATVLYMGMLAKYDYSVVQSMVVPLALIVAFIVARFFFNERLSTVNLVGLGVLIIGIILATRR